MTAADFYLRMVGDFCPAGRRTDKGLSAAEAARILRLAGRAVKRTSGGLWHVGLALYTRRELVAAAGRALAAGEVRPSCR